MERLDPAVWLIAGGLAGALALAGLAARAFSAAPQRLRRGLRIVLGRRPGRVLMACAGDRGLAFSFAARRLAIAWDHGAWGLVYGFDEIAGVELLVDDQVAGFAYRGDLVRAADLPQAPPRQVALRLVFEDPGYPEFELPLFPPEGAARPGPRAAAEALAEAADWFARLGALVGRPTHSWWETSVVAAASPYARPPVASPAPRSAPVS